MSPTLDRTTLPGHAVPVEGKTAACFRIIEKSPLYRADVDTPKLDSSVPASNRCVGLRSSRYARSEQPQSRKMRDLLR